MSGRKLKELSNSHDFANLVRVGRAINALTFSLDLIALAFEPVEKISRADRFGHRSVLVAAGYTMESLKLLNSLERDYKSEPFFMIANTLLSERSRWKIVEKLRDRSGFHLDHRDEITSDTIKKLEPKNVDVMSYPGLSTGGGKLLDVYFNLADVIDTRHFYDVFKTPGLNSERQVNDFIATELSAITTEAIRASHAVLLGLFDKLGFSYSYE